MTTSVQTNGDLVEVVVTNLTAIIISLLAFFNYHSDVSGVCEGDSGSPPALHPLHNHHQANCRG